MNFEELKLRAKEIEQGNYQIISRDEVATLIDHTNLKPTSTPRDIENLIEEAIRHRFKTICINPCYVRLAAQKLEGSRIEVCTVIGFPLGQNTTEIKIRETERALEDGASEFDMVLNVGKLKAGDYEYVKNEIAAIKKIVGDKILKVIIETAYLEDTEKVKATELIIEAGADFVKTSTGFGPGGATVYDVLILSAVTQGKIGVKAAGGIRSYEDALKMITAGATRIGASRSVQIVTE
ncbi:MAG TPA: deoxyribose-phosphate aldolase [candidate division WOR-3 bacterium]|uniref:Deoxyribose-phosphate aldolase n=1 Tax=candidate division WOR-3 bacterium TaxID=2052148 RepID=A0A7V0Q625_UNCW3|nr:deoxyribose-phosphate aldolase [candidate division WOR-3 bacterium]